MLQGAFEVGPSVNSDESGVPSSEIRSKLLPLSTEKAKLSAGRQRKGAQLAAVRLVQAA